MASPKFLNFSEMGQIIIYLGESQNGHLPLVFSHKIAIIRSTEPKIAL